MRTWFNENATAVVADDWKETLKRVGGSRSDDWNHVLGNQAIQSLWIKQSDNEMRERQFNAAIAGLIGIAPQDEIEGMIAAQLIAAHNATMECYRRAMIGEQTMSMCTPAGRRWWGWWKARGEGIGRFQRIKPMQSKLPMHLSRRCGARTRSGSACRSAAMPNGRCRMHGGMSPGAPKGNKNAFKHGHYTAEAIASRREIAKLLRDARALVKQGELG